MTNRPFIQMHVAAAILPATIFIGDDGSIFLHLGSPIPATELFAFVAVILGAVLFSGIDYGLIHYPSLPGSL